MKPNTLSSQAWRHFASSTVSIVPPGMSPALFTRISTASHSFASWRRAAPSRRSTLWVLTSPPRVRDALASRSLSRAARCTWHPSATNAWAHARPMPFDPPVIRTDLPFNARSIRFPRGEAADARLYHRHGEHQGPREVPGVREARRPGERQAWQPLPGARRQEAHAGGRCPVRADRGERIPRRRDGEEVLPLAGIPGGAPAPARRGGLPHGDRRG